MYILLTFRKTYLFSAVDQYVAGGFAFRLPLRVTDGRFLRAQFPRITFEDSSFYIRFQGDFRQNHFPFMFFAHVMINILNRNTDDRRQSPGRVCWLSTKTCIKYNTRINNLQIFFYIHMCL